MTPPQNPSPAARVARAAIFARPHETCVHKKALLSQGLNDPVAAGKGFKSMTIISEIDNFCIVKVDETCIVKVDEKISSGISADVVAIFDRMEAAK